MEPCKLCFNSTSRGDHNTRYELTDTYDLACNVINSGPPFEEWERTICPSLVGPTDLPCMSHF